MILRLVVLLSGFGILFFSCGKTEFQDSSTSKRQVQPEPEPEPEPDPEPDPDPGTSDAIPEEIVTGNKLSSVDWFWQCDTAPVDVPGELESGQKVLQGPGPHNIPVDKGLDFEVHLSGFLCPPKTLSRDIVIVVDVSGSTASTSDPTDPVMNGQGDPNNPFDVAGEPVCERKKAVGALLKTLEEQENVQIGLLTFEDGIVENTERLMGVDELIELYQNSNSLCEGLGGTSYVSAFEGAERLFDKGRLNSIREVYFLTDGEPNDLIASADKAQDLRVKSKLVTLMFGSKNDSHLKNNIASKDDNQVPLHTRVRNAKNLSKALGESARSIPVEGVFKYREIGTSTWQEEDLWQYTKEGVFDIPALSFSPVDFEAGFEFSYIYKDNKGEEYGQSGIIKWEE